MTRVLQDIEIIPRPFNFRLGPQNQRLATIMDSDVAAPEGLTSGVGEMPGGHNAYPHFHRDSPIVVFIHKGHAATLVGEDMVPVLHAPGSVCHILKGIPHIGVNLDVREPVDLFEVRTDPLFNSDVVPRPDLEELVAQRVAELQRDFAAGRFAAELARRSAHVVRLAR